MRRRKVVGGCDADGKGDVPKLYGQDAVRFFALNAGLAGIAKAFAIVDDPRFVHDFPMETKERVRDLARELNNLFTHGGFDSRLGAVAQADPEFQRFMQRAASGDAL